MTIAESSQLGSTPLTGPPRGRRSRRRRAPGADGAVDFTIITGLSGAGRSEAAKNLEDLGYFVIDNLPPALIERMASLVSGPGIKVKDVALVVDVRGGEFFPELEKALAGLRERGIPYRILFLEASDQTIVRRFEATRRRHPLAVSERVIDGIHEERSLMAGLREQADLVIDTTEVNVHGLRDKIKSFFLEAAPRSGIAGGMMQQRLMQTESQPMTAMQSSINSS